jgi:hypothetical protein
VRNDSEYPTLPALELSELPDVDVLEPPDADAVEPLDDEVLELLAGVTEHAEAVRASAAAPRAATADVRLSLGVIIVESTLLHWGSIWVEFWRVQGSAERASVGVEV